MDYSALATEMLAATAAMMKSNGPKQAQSFMQGEMFILHYISHKNTDVIPSEISTAMNASSARVAMALKTLESKGLIERRIDQADRRKIIVTLTDRGRAMTTCQHAEMHARVEKILTELGESEAREYIRIVNRMTEISKRISYE